MNTVVSNFRSVSTLEFSILVLTPKWWIPLQGSVFMESSWLLCWSCWIFLTTFFCNKCAFRSGEFASFPHAKETHFAFFLFELFSLFIERKQHKKLALSGGIYLQKSVYLWECIFFLFSHCDYFVLVIHFPATVVSFRVVSELLIRQLCFLPQLVSLDLCFPFHLNCLLCHLNFELLVFVDIFLLRCSVAGNS